MVAWLFINLLASLLTWDCIHSVQGGYKGNYNCRRGGAVLKRDSDAEQL